MQRVFSPCRVLLWLACAPALAQQYAEEDLRQRHTDQDGDDDFHLYVMNLDDRSVRQITFGAGAADMEPDGLPNTSEPQTLVFPKQNCAWSSSSRVSRSVMLESPSLRSTARTCERHEVIP